MHLVAEASNGREAIHQFRAHRPDITLMDLQMPDINGCRCDDRHSKRIPEARIIILTTFIADIEAAMKVGARAYLLKTMLDKELLETIRAVHAGKRFSRESQQQVAQPSITGKPSREGCSWTV